MSRKGVDTARLIPEPRDEILNNGTELSKAAFNLLRCERVTFSTLNRRLKRMLKISIIMRWKSTSEER